MHAHYHACMSSRFPKYGLESGSHAVLMEDMESPSTLAWTDQCVRQQTLEQECTQQARTMGKHNCIDGNAIGRGDGWPACGDLAADVTLTAGSFLREVLHYGYIGI